MEVPGIVRRATAAVSESGDVDFKADFDPSRKADWCELLKDLIAMINTAGGVVLFGVNNDGTPSGADLSKVKALDPAVLVDKFFSYTGSNYSDIRFFDAERGGRLVYCLVLEAAAVPLVPIRPGTYEKQPGKQVAAFSTGVVYCRHGAKSEPATTEDIAAIIERRVRQDRRRWLAGLRKVVAAPIGSEVSVVVTPPVLLPGYAQEASSASPRGALSKGPNAAPIRLTDDPAAPAVRLLEPRDTHPWRMSELLKNVNKGLSHARISAYDVTALGTTHGAYRNREFCYEPIFGPRTFSPAFSEWLIAQEKKDRLFFVKARAKLRSSRRRARR